MSKPHNTTATRSRLLDATVEAAARDGYADMTVAQVIDYAGASRSTFYKYFVDKDECFLEAASEIGGRLGDAVERRLLAEDPEKVPLIAAEVVLGFAMEHVPEARLLFTELLAGGSRARVLRDELIDRIAGAVEAAWSRATQPAPTHDLPAKALIGGVFRLLSFRMRRGTSKLHDLQPIVLEWISSYLLEEGPPQWQDTKALEALEFNTDTPVSRIRPPSPLRKGRHGLAPDDISRNHDDRLQHATAACVYEKGYASVSVADIVANAKVSRGVFYSHFHDKQMAAIEAMELAFSVSMTPCLRAFFSASEWSERLWAGARALDDSYAAGPELIYLAFVEGYAVGAPAIKLVEERMLAFTYLLGDGYSYRPEAQNLSREISEIIAFATFELAYREVRHKQPGEFSHLLPQLAYINLAPFMGSHNATTFVHNKMRKLAIKGG